MDDFAYMVRAGGRYVLTEDYSLAYEYATGRRLGGNRAGDDVPGEDRISILHTRGREYVCDLSSDRRVIENQEACVNRRYDCGHLAYGPPKRLPADCPECKPVATDGGTDTGDYDHPEHVEQDQIEVHWMHPRTQLENPVLQVWPNPTREEWAAEVVEDGVAAVVCRTVLWKDSEGEIRKHAERVAAYDPIPAYVERALLEYDSEYGPVDEVVNPVNSDDATVPADPRTTLADYFDADEERGSV